MGKIDVERYFREGFLTQNSVLSTDEIKTLRLESDRLLKLCTDESERYAKRIEWEVDHLQEVERAGMELFEDKLNLKLPGGSPYPWHQDWVCCWRAHTDDLVTCFIYLDDADATNGCLQVIPGSHLGKPILPFKPGGRFEIDPAYVDTAKAVPAPLKAGEMIFFDSYLLHYSDLNRSRLPRRAIIYTYNPSRMGKINELRFHPIEL
jgi:ectoine hydroxylase-related dioxygenase (phytanoyl-CoA dioxygenase family)